MLKFARFNEINKQTMAEKNSTMAVTQCMHEYTGDVQMQKRDKLNF